MMRLDYLARSFAEYEFATDRLPNLRGIAQGEFSRKNFSGVAAVVSKNLLNFLELYALAAIAIEGAPDAPQKAAALVVALEAVKFGMYGTHRVNSLIDKLTSNYDHHK